MKLLRTLSSVVRMIYREATLSLSVGFLALAVVLGLSFGSSEYGSFRTQRNVLDTLCSSVKESQIDAVHEYAVDAGERHFIDSNLVLAVIAAESSCRSKAKSHAGARGLMQLMPGTARDMGVSNIFSARENVIGGTKYLAYLLERFSSTELALAAYNAGPGNVRKYGGIPPYRETRNYVRRVMKFYRLFSGEGDQSSTATVA